MKKSEDITNLAAALLKAQAEIKNAPKSAINPHFRNKYVPLDEMIPVCKEALNANGISFIQGAEQSEHGDVLHLSTMLLHTSGQWIESTLTMRPVKPDPQGIGSCITYARRYALAAICGVASDEDDDANAASHSPEPAKTAKKAKTEAAPKTEQELAVDMLRELFGQLPTSQKTLDTMKTILPISDFGQVKDCTLDQLNEGIDKLNILLSETK